MIKRLNEAQKLCEEKFCEGMDYSLMYALRDINIILKKILPEEIHDLNKVAQHISGLHAIGVSSTSIRDERSRKKIIQDIENLKRMLERLKDIVKIERKLL